MITICLLTYNRLLYARRTLESALNHIKYDGNLAWHIADDGSPAGYVDELATMFIGKHITNFTCSNSERGGYGANYNLAMQTIHPWSEFVLPLEDDWELLRDLDLGKLSSDLLVLGGGCVRLGYIGFTQSLHGKFKAAPNGMYLRLDRDSDEPHVFAGHPRLETTEWSRLVGPWTEGLGAGATEFEVAHRSAARERVFWPLDLVHPRGDLFAHIGTERAEDID